MYPFISLFSIQISTYFLVISLACVVCTLWFLRRAEQRNLIRTTAIDLTLTCLAGGFIGARLLHVLWEEPEFYLQNPAAIFYLWNGGFVFYGGVIGAWLACTIFCILRVEAFWYWADVGVPCISLGYAIGRVACFLNGCCYGRYCELPWAVHMHGGFRHPTQLYASLWEFLICAFLLLIERRTRLAGVLFSTWLVLHSVGRVIMEIFRDDPRGPFMFGASVGTWMSLGLGLVGHSLCFPALGTPIEPLFTEPSLNRS